MKENCTAITSTDPSCAEQAKSIAQELSIPFIETSTTYRYLIVVTPDYIGLQKTDEKKLSPFYIDFLSGKSLYRQQKATLRKELLARALGVRPNEQPKIIDATAGLGRDSLMLAALGFKVTMIERSPILYVLLRNALDRAAKDASMGNIVNRLQLIHADAKGWLAGLSAADYPDVIYMDPMFPARRKAAAVKKEMAILQDLLGKEEDEAQLLLIARRIAKKRVIVKRPRVAENIGQLPASYQLTGKSSRFDIYLADNHGKHT